MNDPYSVLGISPNATDEEISKAYKNLAKKYHPDNYANSPLIDVATEKMQEINEAYDQIRKSRQGIGNGNNNNYGGYNSYYKNSGGSANNSGSTKYRDVRLLIKGGRIADADQILMGVPVTNRDAEWFFLKGTILYRKGWTEQAYKHFQTACNMDPNNVEYRSALNQMYSGRKGNNYGYNYGSKSAYDKNTCCTNSCYNISDEGDLCATLCCLDVCCECMGGDCINCI